MIIKPRYKKGRLFHLSALFPIHIRSLLFTEQNTMKEVISFSLDKKVHLFLDLQVIRLIYPDRYRGSPLSTNSLSTIPGIVRIQNCTKQSESPVLTPCISICVLMYVQKKAYGIMYDVLVCLTLVLVRSRLSKVII